MNKQIFCIFSAISIILLGCSSSNVSDPASSIPSVSFPVSSYEGKEQISDEMKASVISSIKNSFKSLSSLEDNYASYYNSNASLKDLANGYQSWGSGTEAHSLTIYNNHFSSWESTTKYEIHNGDVNTFESYSSIVETLPMKSSSTPNENYQLFSKTTSSRGGYQNRGEKYTLKNPSFCSESTLDAAWDGYTADSVYAYLIRENYTFYQVGDDVHMVSRFQDVTSYEKNSSNSQNSIPTMEYINKKVGIIKKDSASKYRLDSLIYEESYIFLATLSLEPIKEVSSKTTRTIILRYEDRKEGKPSFTYENAKEATDNAPLIFVYQTAPKNGGTPSSKKPMYNKSDEYRMVHGKGYCYEVDFFTTIGAANHPRDIEYFALSDQYSYDNGQTIKYPSSSLVLPSNSLFITVDNGDGTFYVKKTKDSQNIDEIRLSVSITFEDKFLSPTISVTF